MFDVAGMTSHSRTHWSLPDVSTKILDWCETMVQAVIADACARATMIGGWRYEESVDAEDEAEANHGNASRNARLPSSPPETSSVVPLARARDVSIFDVF